MNLKIQPRQKNLAIAVGSIVVLAVAILGVRALLMKPLKDLDGRIASTRVKLNKIQTERRDYFVAEEKVKGYAQRLFADSEDQASAKSGEMLTRLIIQSGLREADFTRTPFAPSLLRTGLKTTEIGWSVQGDGSLSNIINLCFLLRELPFLHRVESLAINPGDSPGQVRVRFRFLTLVIKPAPTVETVDLQPKIALNTPERKVFDGIAIRDLLRPYIKRPPNPPPPPGSPRTPPSAPGTPPGPETFKIVSLSEWMGQPEIHVRDLTTQKTLRFKPGDALAGGQVVMVDYRPLPLPGNDALKSFSRVIVKIGSEYWAIERGRTFADKYKLPADYLPEQLTKLTP